MPELAWILPSIAIPVGMLAALAVTALVRLVATTPFDAVGRRVW